MTYARSMGGNPGPVPANRGRVALHSTQPAQHAPAQHKREGPYDMRGATSHALSMLAGGVPGDMECAPGVNVHALQLAVDSALRDQGASYRADIGLRQTTGYYSIVAVSRREKGVFD